MINYLRANFLLSVKYSCENFDQMQSFNRWLIDLCKKRFITEHEFYLVLNSKESKYHKELGI